MHRRQVDMRQAPARERAPRAAGQASFETGGPWTAPAPAPVRWSLEDAPPYAGFWRRYGAVVIDASILSAAPSSLARPLRLAITRLQDAGGLPDTGWAGIGVWLGAALAVTMLIQWVYHAGLESSRWRGTPGKRVLRIAVTDPDGVRISFRRATARYFARPLSVMCFLVGYLMQPFTARRQTLHDLIAGTIVIRT